MGKSQVNNIKARSSFLDFQYSDPERNFDRRKVKGVLANLIKPRDSKYNTALDTAVGGRLYNVVVDTNDTASKLLKNGRLTRRITFLPLNKIQGNVINDATLKAARSCVTNGHNLVHRAIDLVDYSNEFDVAIRYALGGVMICSDLNVANKVAYNPNVQRLCVTLDGDKVNPTGEMSGGAPTKSASILAVVAQLAEYTQSLEEKEAQFKHSESEVKRLRNVFQRYNELKHEHDEKSNQLALVRERLKNTQHHRLNEAVTELKSNITIYHDQINEAKETEKQGKQKSSEIEYKIKNAAEIKKKELKDSEAEVKKDETKPTNPSTDSNENRKQDTLQC